VFRNRQRSSSWPLSYFNLRVDSFLTLTRTLFRNYRCSDRTYFALVHLLLLYNLTYFALELCSSNPLQVLPVLRPHILCFGSFTCSNRSYYQYLSPVLYEPPAVLSRSPDLSPHCSLFLSCISSALFLGTHLCSSNPLQELPAIRPHILCSGTFTECQNGCFG